MALATKSRLGLADFVEWAAARPDGRYELVGGHVSAMSPETARHGLTKHAVAKALEAAVARAGLDCTVFPDGIGVAIDDTTMRAPDASVVFGAVDLDKAWLDDPVVVVEVMSPSSIRIDSGEKLEDYFRVPSLRHYLIVDPCNRIAILYSRDGSDGPVSRQLYSAGEVRFAEAGISVPLEALFVEPRR